MAKDRKANIVIGAKDQASKKIGKVKSSLGGLQGSIMAAGAAWLSWKGATALLDATVGAAARQEEIFKKLETAVELTGIAYGDAKYKIDTFLSSMQATTRYGDTDLAPALQQITLLTGDLNKGFEGAKYAADIASTGLFDLNTASRYVAMAMAGEVTMLGRYIPELKVSAGLITQNMTATEKWTIAKGLFNEKFGGAAQRDLDTYAGQLKQFNNYLGDMGEAIGDKVLPYLTEMISRWFEFLKIVGLIQEPLKITTENFDAQKEALTDLDTKLDRVNGRIAANEFQLINARISTDQWLKKSKELSKQKIKLEGEIQNLNDAIQSYLSSLVELPAAQDEVITKTGELDEALTIIDGNIRKRAIGLMDFQRKMMLEEMANRRIIEQDKLNRATFTYRRIMQLHRDLCEDIVEQMWGAQADFKEIFKEMAKDFIKYFIVEITKQLAIAVAKWVATLIFFDVRANDLKVIQMGRDYAHYFQQGVFEGMDTGRLAGGMAGRMLPAGGAAQIGAAVPASTVTVVIQGNVIGQDEYVYNQLIPAIEEAVTRKESNLVVD